MDPESANVRPAATRESRPGGAEGDGVSGFRHACNLCGHRRGTPDDCACVTLPCHVGAFKDESFTVWRCSDCGTIHCREIVDLARYYAAYPYARMKPSWVLRIPYRNQLRRLARLGFGKGSFLLDYGCGSGLFVRYLQQRGYTHSHGYDPYEPPDRFGDGSILDRGPFAYIVLQDVLEHVEDPDELLSRIDSLVAPNGHILIGTPNAARIDLSRSEDFLNELHVPYHLHIYTERSVEAMGRRRGWQCVRFFDRAYHDLPLVGFNSRAGKVYQRLSGGLVDSMLEPFQPLRALRSPRYLFMAVFGYWLSHRSDMALAFRKPGG